MAIRETRTGFLIKKDTEGYSYRRKSIEETTSYWVCIEKENFSCPGRCKVVNNTMIRTGAHTHPVLKLKDLCNSFKDILWAEVVSTEDAPRTIYDRVALNHHLAASTISFVSIERSMNRWRREVRPPVPRSLMDFANLINQDQWKKYRNYAQGRITVVTIITRADTSSTIFGDREFLASLHDIEELYIDATFAVCPRVMQITQFLTIMGRINNVPTALVWALMTKKTVEAYKAVFNYFRTHSMPQIRPRAVHQDFELAMRSAILHTYPDITVIHCYFHYCQAILKRFKKKGHSSMAKLATWDLALVFYRKLLGLALLPAGAIRGAFEWLVQNTAPDVSEFFNDLITYYRNWWLIRLTPEKFSMYRLTNRTNNPIEAYHRILRKRMGIHPGIWEFTAKLKNLQAVTRIEVDSLDRGIQIRRTVRREFVIREDMLDHLWNWYDDGTLNIARFLACFNHVTPALSNDLRINSPEELELISRLPAHNISIQTNDAMEGMIVEGLNPGMPIPILRRNPREENFKIFILENLADSICPRCHRSILNVISLPCNHWFVCSNCTEDLAAQAFTQRAALICGICIRQCVVFKTVQIS